MLLSGAKEDERMEEIMFNLQTQKKFRNWYWTYGIFIDGMIFIAMVYFGIAIFLDK